MLKAADKLPFSFFGRLREPFTLGKRLDMLDFLMLMLFFPGILRATSSKYSDMFSTAFKPSSDDCSGIDSLKDHKNQATTIKRDCINFN